MTLEGHNITAQVQEPGLGEVGKFQTSFLLGNN